MGGQTLLPPTSASYQTLLPQTLFPNMASSVMIKTRLDNTMYFMLITSGCVAD